MTGVNVEKGYQQASNGKQLLKKDDLYFNDMDIRAWERRTAALGGASYGRNDRNYQGVECFFDDSGGPMSAAEYEEMLFQRVLDKIRLARAADVPDVQLTPEELDAYQSKLHGTRSPVALPSRSSRSSPINDTMSVANASTASKKGSSSSRSKKDQQRSSMFSSKPKKEKEKPSSRRLAPSNVSTAPPPGFMIPGPDGQPIYTPINAYQGSLARDPIALPQPTSQAVSDHEPPAMSTRRAMTDMPGAFPGALPTSPHLYRPTTPLEVSHPSPRDLAPAFDDLGVSTQPSSKRSSKSSKSKTAPVEPYQYHDFSSSSSVQSSPKPRYTRRVSSAESSYTAMPRRVPVPSRTTAQPNYLDASLSPHAAGLRVDRIGTPGGEDVMMLDVDAQTDSGKSMKSSKKRVSGSSGGKEEKEKRKSGKGKKRA
ncbi:hypothetical protein N0V91_001529 [Didymella pomorum]|uniref:Uncharacterized protein n=1 Tax=Didymella pomorum TaxID=749634 RepID=A0A9W9DB14_9PLEO|nr:hypothetical protein N0V91_001529 [Didymella pomorum]